VENYTAGKKIAALKEKKNLWLICTVEVMGFILPIFPHPDQQLIAELLMTSVALCNEHSKINSWPQSIKPAVPLHATELLLYLFFFAAVVSELAGPLWGGDRSKGF